MAIRIKQLFQSIDHRDTDAFLAFLSDDVVFRFGNATPVKGKAEVDPVVQDFFDSINALHHDVVETWQQGDAAICHGTVTYTRHDASTLCVPFANIFRLKEDVIREYLIYVDISDLYKNARQGLAE